MNRQRLLFRVLVFSAFFSVFAVAKRVAPKDVPPIISDGMRYSATGDGRNSFVVATDAATGKALWKVKVFHTQIKFWRGEEDNQWLFISDMKLAANSILVRDEKSRCYSISLSTKRVKKTACGKAFPPQESRE
jgi:outer membrane protein assembly factor BamB